MHELQRDPTRVLALLMLIALGPFSMALGQEPKPAAAIQGQVISTSSQPIKEAEISVVGTAATVLTDSTGRFLLRGLPPGPTVLRVRRIGFKAQHLATTLEAGPPFVTVVMLEPGPQILPEVNVIAREAKPIEFAWTTKYDEFFRRKRLGLPGGTFISAEDIRRQPAMHVWEILEHSVPGTRVIVHWLGEEGTEIKFPRCARYIGHVGVWVDGKRANWGPQYQEAPQFSRFVQDPTPGDPKARRMATELADILDLVNPSQIQFMEVYRGIGSIPGEFSGGCGAVVIWTK